MPQPRNRLEDGRGTDDEMSRGIWEEMENRETNEAIMVKAERERKEKKEFRAPTMEEIAIARIVEEKEEEEEDLIELRAVEEIVPRQFHRYLKVFEKKESERMLMRKAWNHAINLRKEFVPKKEKIYPLSRVEREEVQEFVKDQL